MSKFLSNQKLWKIVRQPDALFYEIKAGGLVIDRVKIENNKVKELIKLEIVKA